MNKNTIIAFGDSLVYGYGASPDNDFVSILSKYIDQPILNFGKNGNTTQHGLERLTTVLAEQPAIVLVLLGGNDFLRHVPLKQTFHNLEDIVQQLQAAGATLILLGIQGGIFIDSYKKHFEALAKKYNIAYVPNVLSEILRNKALMSDLIHPNDGGYKIIADKIYPVLKDMVS